MTLEELNKLIDLEIQWLYYYANVDSRNNLNKNSNLYEDLVSIGYTKRVVPLFSRCVPSIITSEETIAEGLNVSKLRKDDNGRGENRYSPVEAFIIIFPDKKMELLNRLKSKD